jgi:uncharacterized protein YecE (DUF72 family)
MEFGKIENITAVNWSLPPDDSNSKLHLYDHSSLTLHLGSPAWGAKQWIGKIYPPKTPAENFLYHYSRQYNCIELNTTHYRIPDEKTTSEWLTKIPVEFEFCPKLFKEISHGRSGLTDKKILNYWIDFLERIRPNLGPCFIQLHELFAYHDKRLLFQFLENWPAEFRLSLELRHPSWFQEGTILPALVDYLHKKNIGLVITDVAGRRDVLHTSLPTDWSMIRLIGNNLDPSDHRRLVDWANRLKEWEKKGLNEAYLFLHQPEDLMTIEFSRLASDYLTKVGFSNLPDFKLKEEENLLSLIGE